MKMTHTFLILSIAIFIVFTTPFFGFGQSSIIETIQSALPAFVDITADGMIVAQNQRPAAAIDKNTGHILILRNAKTAIFKKTGAGIIIDPSGIIVTNYHTVASAKRITVTLSDKTSVSAQMLQAFPDEDFVFLKIIPPDTLIPVYFADSNTLQLNEEIFTVGHSDVLDQTISGGKIIGLGSSRTKSSNTEGVDIFQVNINIYKGDSGGPLLNRRGEFVGLMTAGQLEKDRSSFAVASNKIKKHYLEYLNNRKK